MVTKADYDKVVKKFNDCKKEFRKQEKFLREVQASIKNDDDEKSILEKQVREMKKLAEIAGSEAAKFRHNNIRMEEKINKYERELMVKK